MRSEAGRFIIFASSPMVRVSGRISSLISSSTFSAFGFSGMMNGWRVAFPVLLPDLNPSSVLWRLSFLSLKLFLFGLLETVFFTSALSPEAEAPWAPPRFP